MSGAHINDLITEGCGEVVFGTHPIEVMKFCTNTNGTLFFIHRNRIRNPSSVGNGVDESNYVQLLYLGFHRGQFGRVMGRFFWRRGATSGHVSMWSSMMDGSKMGILVYDQENM